MDKTVLALAKKYAKSLRTHWTDPEQVILDKLVYEPTEDGFMALDKPIGLKPGETYKVSIYDPKSGLTAERYFTATVFEEEGIQIGVALLIQYDENADPMLFLDVYPEFSEELFEGFKSFLVLPLESGAVISIVIPEVVHKIPPKYAPILTYEQIPVYRLKDFGYFLDDSKEDGRDRNETAYHQAIESGKVQELYNAILQGPVLLCIDGKLGGYVFHRELLVTCPGVYSGTHSFSEVVALSGDLAGVFDLYIRMNVIDANLIKLALSQ